MNMKVKLTKKQEQQMKDLLKMLEIAVTFWLNEKIKSKKGPELARTSTSVGHWFETLVVSEVLENILGSSGMQGFGEGVEKFKNIIWVPEPFGVNTFPDFGLYWVSNPNKKIDFKNGTTAAFAIDAKTTWLDRKGNLTINLGTANSFGSENRKRFNQFYVCGMLYNLKDTKETEADQTLVEGMLSAIGALDNYVAPSNKQKSEINSGKVYIIDEAKIINPTSGKNVTSIAFVDEKDLKDSWHFFSPVGSEFVELWTELSTMKKYNENGTQNEFWEYHLAFTNCYSGRMLSSSEGKEKQLLRVMENFAEGVFDGYIEQMEKAGSHKHKNLWKEVLDSKFQSTAKKQEWFEAKHGEWLERRGK